MKPISACPSCGAPIYGPESVAPGETPTLVRSCACLPLLAIPLPASPPSFPTLPPQFPRWPDYPYIGDAPGWWWGQTWCGTGSTSAQMPGFPMSRTTADDAF